MSVIYLHLNGDTYHLNNSGVTKETFNSPFLSSVSGLFINPETDTYETDELTTYVKVSHHTPILLGNIVEVDGVKTLKCFSNVEKAPEEAYEEYLDALLRNKTENATISDKAVLKKFIRLVKKPCKATIGTEYPTKSWSTSFLPETELTGYDEKTGGNSVTYRQATVEHEGEASKPQFVLNADYYFEVYIDHDAYRQGDIIPLEYYDNLRGKLNIHGIPVNPEHYRLVAQGHSTSLMGNVNNVIDVGPIGRGGGELVVGDESAWLLGR